MKRNYFLISSLFCMGIAPMMGQSQSLHNFEQVTDTITALQPPPTLGIDPVCAGSVIDVPFISTGSYNVSNIYYAELIDSIGNIAKIDTIGNLISNVAYSYPPADIITTIPLTANTGCHYYIRVISTTPGNVAIEWGPFCIQHCNILTNNEQGVQACLGSCNEQPQGYIDTISFNIHEFDSHVKYRAGNKFEVQLIAFNLFPLNFSIINTGLLGVVVDTVSGKLLLHVPCPDTLSMYGINPGIYYARIIADSSSIPDSALGTLVHISIGEPADSTYLTMYPSAGPFCQGTPVQITAHPNNSNQGSTYSWWETDKTHGTLLFPGAITDPISLYLEGADTLTITVQENSFGCLGKKAILPDTIISIGLPDITKTGPITVCINDTNVYSIPINVNTNYTWNVYAKSSFIIRNNELIIKFDSAGVFKVSVVASNQCFMDSTEWVVHVLSDSVCTASVKNVSDKENVSVYPNPSNGIITLQAQGEELVDKSEVSVYNVLGEQVFTETLRSTQGGNTINLSNQPNGIYLYRVITETGALLGEGKLIIQK
jgi:hypothetical protein